MVQYYGVSTVPMKRNLKEVHGRVPKLSISKAALHTFADMVGQFQLAVTRNANGRPSKKSNASLSAGDIRDGFRSFCGDLFHYISTNRTPTSELLMGKGVYPLPLKRTMDIIKSVVRNRRVTKKACALLNEYAFTLTLHMIKVAGDKASAMGHSRISLDDFKTVYGLQSYGLHKIRLDELNRRKKKSPSSYTRIKIHDGGEDSEVGEFAKALDSEADTDEEAEEPIYADEQGEADDGAITEDEELP